MFCKSGVLPFLSHFPDENQSNFTSRRGDTHAILKARAAEKQMIIILFSMLEHTRSARLRTG